MQHDTNASMLLGNAMQLQENAALDYSCISDVIHQQCRIRFVLHYANAAFDMREAHDFDDARSSSDTLFILCGGFNNTGIRFAD